jgi:hypothetical protein
MVRPLYSGSRRNQEAKRIRNLEHGGWAGVLCLGLLQQALGASKSTRGIPLSMADISKHLEMADGQFHVMKQGGARRRGAGDDPDDSSGTSRLKN